MLTALMFSLFSTAQAQDVPLATVNVTTNKPGFTLTEIISRGQAQSSQGVTASAIYTKDVCVAPCVFETEPRMIELYGSGKGKLARARSFSLPPGESTLEIQPGSSALFTLGRYVGYVGIGVASTGAAFLIVDELTADDGLGRTMPLGVELGLLGGGLAMLGGGIALQVTNGGKMTFTPTANVGTGPVRL